MKPFTLKAEVKAWYDLPNGRFREVQLVDVTVTATSLDTLTVAVREKALALLKRRKCESLRLTVMFRTVADGDGLPEGVEGKLSYLAERGQ